jgi:hypothetical protein
MPVLVKSHCYDRARDVRALAAKTTIAEIRCQLLEIAAHYDALAAQSWAHEALREFKLTRRG